MTTYRYSTDTNREGIAKAVGLDLPISRKKGIEICNFIRKKELSQAKKILERVIEQKQAIPYRRFNKDTGHKPGIGPGRYPIKTCQEIKMLLERVEASAEQKGLDTKLLVITHISTQPGGSRMHYGRQRRRKMKRAHVEVVVEERKDAKREAKPETKKEGKTDAKKETKVETKKELKAEHGRPEQRPEPKKEGAEAKKEIKAETKHEAKTEHEAKK